MQRMNRLFEIIQVLRGASGPMRAEDLAARLEVSSRTIYRDVAALQGMGTPIEGEAGIGYMMRRGYDLPPLNFDGEEIEALRVGLSMLARSGDSSLQQAAKRICTKIEALQTPADWLRVAPYGVPLDDPALGCVSRADLRQAIREERVLRITYRDLEEVETVRDIRPIALIYLTETVLLAAWCQMRGAFRHFRAERIWTCDETGARFTGEGAMLRGLWNDQEPRDW